MINVNNFTPEERIDLIEVLLASLNDVTKLVHQNNRDKGFWEKPIDLATRLMLINSELCEAVNADRKDKYSQIDKFEQELIKRKLSIDNFRIGDPNCEVISKLFEKYVKDSFEDEFGDAFIRSLDVAGGINLNNIFKHIIYKLRYNVTRDYMHGAKY